MEALGWPTHNWAPAGHRGWPITSLLSAVPPSPSDTLTPKVSTWQHVPGVREMAPDAGAMSDGMTLSTEARPALQ